MAPAPRAPVRFLLVLTLVSATLAGCSSAPRQYCRENAQLELTWYKTVLPADAAASLSKAGWNASSSGSILTAEHKLQNDIKLSADIFAVSNGTTLRMTLEAQGYSRHPMPADRATLTVPTEQQLGRDLGTPDARTQSDVGHICKTVA